MPQAIGLKDGGCKVNIHLQIPDFDGNAIDIIAEKGATVSVEVHENEVVIAANKEGFLSLAKQMLYMAVNPIPFGGHAHFDDTLVGMRHSAYSLVIEPIWETDGGGCAAAK